MAKINIEPTSFNISEKTKATEEPISDNFRIFEVATYGSTTSKIGKTVEIEISKDIFSLEYVNKKISLLNKRLLTIQSEINKWEMIKTEINTAISLNPMTSTIDK